MPRKKGNPDWGAKKALWDVKQKLTRFEKLAAGMTAKQILKSDKLRQWAKANAYKYYVPEYCLREWGINPEKRSVVPTKA